MSNQNMKGKLSYLFLLLLIIIVIVIVKFYLDKSYSNWFLNKETSRSNISSDISNISNDSEFQNILNEMKNITNEKINSAVESGFVEGFRSMNVDSDDVITSISGGNNYNSDTIIPYTKNNNKIKLMLFYKAKCPYCVEFLPVWYRIINNLPNNVLYEEIECNRNPSKASEYKIINVPTIILVVNNDKSIYIGDRSYNNIKKFLQLNGVNIVERTFEEFDTTGYNSEPGEKEEKQLKNEYNKNCPAATFDKIVDFDNNKHMFQIFSDGQYGYTTGSTKENSIITPFRAAYNQIDTYLSSLPEGKDKKKNTDKYANVEECANLYANEIRNFGLCDEEQLNEILKKGKGQENYKEQYNSNNKIVSAIKKACEIY